MNYTYEELLIINHWQRSSVTHEVLGDYLAVGDGVLDFDVVFTDNKVIVFQDGTEAVISDCGYSM